MLWLICKRCHPRHPYFANGATIKYNMPTTLTSHLTCRTNIILGNVAVRKQRLGGENISTLVPPKVFGLRENVSMNSAP